MFKLNNSRRYNIQLHLRTSLVDFTRKEWKAKREEKRGSHGNRNTICLGSFTRPRTSFSKPFNKATKWL